MNNEAKILLGVVLLTVCLLGGFVFFTSKTSQPAAAVDSQLLIRQNSNQLTSEKTPVTIVEFGDYQCPACAAAQPAVTQILEKYPGKVNLVFRHFPLPQHANALMAAEAAEAAGAQGKYWQMHQLLYQNQTEWAETANPQNVFADYAKKLGLNEDQFKNDLSIQKYADKIKSDKDDGLSLNVNATPTFYINGVKLTGFSISQFESRINQLLK